MRTIAKSSLLLALFVVLIVGCGEVGEYEPRSGDVVFQVSQSSQSAAIQRATGSKYSHMGIVFVADGQPLVFEAAGTVHLTPLREWIARGEGGHFVAMRLANAEQLLDSVSLEKLKHIGERYNGRPYDLYFEWSDERIYCSELVWKVFKGGLDLEVGKLQRLRDFDLSDPLVKAKLTERFGQAVPLDEIVISPAAMMNSDLLIRLYSR